jgi:putative ABC transport system permease protein
MLKNYFKIALRNLLKYKGYSFINIFGLAVGIGCCLLIFIYVKDELTYDRFQSKGDRIYRLNSMINWDGDKDLSGMTGQIEAPSFADRIPEIEAYTRFAYSSIVAQLGDEWIRQFNALYTDEGTFQIFDYEVISGSLNGALDELNNIVIARSVAEKFFNTSDAAGKEMRIKLNGKVENYIVTAVYENFPGNSSLDAEVYFSWDKYRTFSKMPSNPWSNLSISSVLLFKESPVDIEAIEAKFKEVRYAMNPDEVEDKWAREVESRLQRFDQIHLNSDIDSNTGIKAPSDATYSYILGGIGLLILMLACINFANLSVARSIPRAKEIGLRKVMGAQSKQVARQFLGEALIVSIISFVIGLIISELFLPTFARLVNKKFAYGIIQDPWLIAASFIFIFITALLAGSYPAFFMSRFSILNSLSGKVKLNSRQYLTKGLVMFQFAIAAVLVIGTLTMYQQINFMLNTDLGYDDQNLAVVHMGLNREKTMIMTSELSTNPNFVGVSKSDGFNAAYYMGYKDKSFWTITASVDTSYLNVIGLKLKSGRNLKHLEDFYYRRNDTLKNMIVTQAFIDKLDYQGDPLGLVIHDGEKDNPINEFRIVGILDDFIYADAKKAPAPIALIAGHPTRGFSQVNVRYREGYDTEVQAALQEAWRKVDPYAPMSFSFKEESNQNSYREEMRWRAIITAASVIAIIISCLGLFGMAHLSAQQRQKEIGVRKVLGASVGQLIYMLNIGFTKLVIISALIAIPISYYFVEDWLSGFAFRIEMGLMVFLIPTVLTLIVALSTVSVQSFRTANSNPVNSLRSE